MLQTIAWTGQAVRLLDQTRLPAQTVYIDITSERQMWDAIKRLAVRGAPAIGVAAAFGVYLAVRDYRGSELLGLYERLNAAADHLGTCRPTAINLFWALDRIRRVSRDVGRDTSDLQSAQAIDLIKQRILSECLAMIDEDNRVCRAIGEHGLKLLEAITHRPIEILTHCNAGGLATVQYGTALAPVYLAAERGIPVHVWCDETRPLLQGSRITAFELKENKIPATVICDSTAAAVMREGRVHAVIVGTDRVAGNGDVANKIGTLSLAIVARHFGVPFYVAAPISSIDLSIVSGEQIPIEQRDPREVSHGMGKATAPEGADIYNPAFDVTSAELVSAIITERGALRPPYGAALAALRGE